MHPHDQQMRTNTLRRKKSPTTIKLEIKKTTDRNVKQINECLLDRLKEEDKDRSREGGGNSSEGSTTTTRRAMPADCSWRSVNRQRPFDDQLLIKRIQHIETH